MPRVLWSIFLIHLVHMFLVASHCMYLEHEWAGISMGNVSQSSSLFVLRLLDLVKDFFKITKHTKDNTPLEEWPCCTA